MTNEELIKNFPECDRIKRTDMTDCVSRVFDEVKFYREVNDFMTVQAQRYWPKPPLHRREDSTNFDIWVSYFYSHGHGTLKYCFQDWCDEVAAEFLRRKGKRRTFEEACRLAADKWTCMIFLNHFQDNGDKTAQGLIGNLLASIAKNEAKSGYGKDVMEKFHANIEQHYLNHCIFNHERWGRITDTPYCDYQPNAPLRRALKDSGCKDDDIDFMCPNKTGISIDEGDNSVCIRGYQTHTYI